MTSEAKPRRAAVWIWLPSQTAPVAAGALEEREPGGPMAFAYAPSYLERTDAMRLHPTELPLRSGTFEPEGAFLLPNALRDGAPDAWGRRVINHSLGDAETDLAELDYLLKSGSDRPGAQKTTRPRPSRSVGPRLEVEAVRGR